GRGDVRAADTDLLVGQEGLAAVGADAGEDLRGHVGQARVARVVPRHGQVAGRLVQGHHGQELAVDPRIIVDADGGSPRRPVVVGVADEDVHIVALVGRLVRVDQVHAAVVGTAAAVVNHVGFRVNGTIRLRGNVIEIAHVGGCDGDGQAEAART